MSLYNRVALVCCCVKFCKCSSKISSVVLSAFPRFWSIWKNEFKRLLKTQFHKIEMQCISKMAGLEKTWDAVFNALRESSLGIFADADDSLARIMSFDSIFLVLSFLLLYLINPHTTRCRRLMPKTCKIGLLLHNCHALFLHNLYYGDFHLCH